MEQFRFIGTVSRTLQKSYFKGPLLATARNGRNRAKVFATVVIVAAGSLLFIA
jgi:hypothetical protein